MTDEKFLNTFRAGSWQAANDSDGNWFSGTNAPSKRPTVQPSKFWICEKGSWWAATPDWTIADIGLADVDVELASVDRLYQAIEAKRLIIRQQHPAGLIWNPCSWAFLIASPRQPTTPRPSDPKPKPKSPRELRVEERDARLAEVWSLFHEGTISSEIRDERLRAILDQYSDLN
jgi:hypothetical protein